MMKKMEDAVVEKEFGVYSAPLYLFGSLERRRSEFEGYVHKAQVIVREFAERYGWSQLVKESFFDRVEIFDDKESFDARVIELNGMEKGIRLPATFSAGLEQRVLFSVSPELYAKNYPSGVEEDYFEKLLAHEIIHRLHIRILDGDEDAMGPIWFFEGFALFGADQFGKSSMKLSDEEVGEIVHSSERGSYEKYSFVFRDLIKKLPLEDMVRRAGREGFTEYVLGNRGK